MINNLLIISARPYGREVYSWAIDAIKAGAPWTVKGFLDDRHDALAGFPCAVGVISSLEQYEPQSNDLFVCAIGDPNMRKRYVEKAKLKQCRFANLVHPTSVIGQNVRMGEGIVIAPMVVLTADVTLGNFVHIGCGADLLRWAR